MVGEEVFFLKFGCPKEKTSIGKELGGLVEEFEVCLHFARQFNIANALSLKIKFQTCIPSKIFTYVLEYLSTHMAAHLLRVVVAIVEPVQ